MQSTTGNGASLWSAVARHRFGSHLRIPLTPRIKDPSGLPFNHYLGIEADYQSGVEPPHSKRSADLIHVQASFLCVVPIVVGRIYEATRLLVVGHFRLGRIPQQLLTW